MDPILITEHHLFTFGLDYSADWTLPEICLANILILTTPSTLLCFENTHTARASDNLLPIALDEDLVGRNHRLIPIYVAFPVLPIRLVCGDNNILIL